jgi:hypothetical protein
MRSDVIVQMVFEEIHPPAGTRPIAPYLPVIERTAHGRDRHAENVGRLGDGVSFLEM